MKSSRSDSWGVGLTKSLYCLPEMKMKEFWRQQRSVCFCPKRSRKYLCHIVYAWREIPVYQQLRLIIHIKVGGNVVWLLNLIDTLSWVFIYDPHMVTRILLRGFFECIILFRNVASVYGWKTIHKISTLTIVSSYLIKDDMMANQKLDYSTIVKDRWFPEVLFGLWQLIKIT